MGRKDYGRWFDQLSGSDYSEVGKKVANLGEMIGAGMRVTPGFGITMDANHLFLEECGIKEEIETLCADPANVSGDALAGTCSRIKSRVEAGHLPEELAADVSTRYEELCRRSGVDDVPVAVRSSGAVSMPGQMETFLNIRGVGDVFSYLRQCWASAYSPEALGYRLEAGLEAAFPIGVAVQKMVSSVTAGVMFTLHPVTGDRSKIYIEASWGLGEAVVSGLVSPDIYVVDKVTGEILERQAGDKAVKCIYRDRGSDIVQCGVEEADRSSLCLSDAEVLELARLGRRIEAHYGGTAYDVEFGVDGDFDFPENAFILQVRPESVWSKRRRENVLRSEKDNVSRITSTWRNLKA